MEGDVVLSMAKHEVSTLRQDLETDVWSSASCECFECPIYRVRNIKDKTLDENCEIFSIIYSQS